MLKFETGDIVKGNYPIICQQVNCCGVMGAGLAKQIKDRYPNVYWDYKRALDYENAKLGHIIISHETGLNGRIIVSMLAQNQYGRDKRYTDYEAFQNCLNVMEKELSWYGDQWNTIAFPYKIGCGLAGGDWNIILDMITNFSNHMKKLVVIVKRGE